MQSYLKLAIQNQINLWTLDTMTKYWNTVHFYYQLHTTFYLYMTPPTIPSPHTLSNHPPHTPLIPKCSNYCHMLHPLPHALPNPTHNLSLFIHSVSLHIVQLWFNPGMDTFFSFFLFISLSFLHSSTGYFSFLLSPFLLSSSLFFFSLQS